MKKDWGKFKEEISRDFGKLKNDFVKDYGEFKENAKELGNNLSALSKRRGNKSNIGGGKSYTLGRRNALRW